eukprot:TRINITY_DN2167_c0_g1_i4.p3 TRINITY_DN2167_c0_g1~~TRINITY_DN2167_c0_g1_i4.p3  ORF type:complete len:177 (-),score=17.06 TRINITY_DN2167_c0_g1_i4:139-669(-)
MQLTSSNVCTRSVHYIKQQVHNRTRFNRTYQITRSQSDDSKQFKSTSKLTAQLLGGFLILPAAALAQNQIFEVSGIDANTAGLLALIFRPVLAVGQILMISRIILTWYPQIDTSKLPWSVSYAPTEPVLSVTRKIIKPVGGVDVSPIVWFAILSFSNEILIGPQGILNLIQQKGGI